LGRYPVGHELASFGGLQSVSSTAGEKLDALILKRPKYEVTIDDSLFSNRLFRTFHELKRSRIRAGPSACHRVSQWMLAFKVRAKKKIQFLTTLESGARFLKPARADSAPAGLGQPKVLPGDWG
jgi:hypothetical protein